MTQSQVEAELESLFNTLRRKLKYQTDNVDLLSNLVSDKEKEIKELKRLWLEVGENSKQTATQTKQQIKARDERIQFLLDLLKKQQQQESKQKRTITNIDDDDGASEKSEKKNDLQKVQNAIKELESLFNQRMNLQLELDHAIDEKRNELNELEDKQKQQRQQREEAAESNKNLNQAEMEHLKSKLYEREQELSNKDRDIKELQIQILQQQQQRQQQEAPLPKMSSKQQHELIRQVNQALNDIERLIAQKADKEQELKLARDTQQIANKAKIQQLHYKLQMLQVQYNDAIRKLTALNEDQQRAIELRNEQMAHIKARNQEKLRNADNIIAEKMQNIQLKEQEIDDLQGKLNDAMAQMRQTKHLHNDQIKQLESQYNESLAKLMRNRNETELLKDQLSRLQAEKATDTETVRSMKQLIDDSVSMLQHKERKIQKLTQQLDATRFELQNHERDDETQRYRVCAFIILCLGKYVVCHCMFWLQLENY